MLASQGTYDVIILGGGAAGCVIASRLAEANSKLSILVVEAGKNSKDDAAIQEPIRYLSLLMSDKVRHYTTEPDARLPDNRQITFAQGNVLGGGSSVK